MQQRYYDPEIWRFLSANPVTTNLGDPLRLAQPGDACAELDEEGAVTQVTRDAYGKPTAINVQIEVEFRAPQRQLLASVIPE